MNPFQNPSCCSSTQWKVGTFFGNTVFIQPMFLILIAIIALSGINSYFGLAVGLVLIPVLVFSVLFHELAHALLSKFFGYGNSTIILHGFGGVSINDTHKYRPPLKSAAIFAAGPISSGLLAAIGYLLLTFILPFLPLTGNIANLVYAVLQNFMWLNLVFAIFNALPIIPMDGGNVVVHLLQHFMKNDRTALKTAAYISFATLILATIALLFFYPGSGIITIFVVAMLAIQNINLIRSV